MTTSSTINHKKKVAVIGAGSFGSAMVKVLEQCSRQQQKSTNTHIWWYARRQSIVDEINTHHTNQQYFEGAVFDESIVTASCDLHECVQHASMVVLSVPSNFLKPLLHQLQGALTGDAILVSVIKSLHYDTQTKMITTAIDDIQSVLPNHPTVALSGPNLYKEMINDDCFSEATIAYNDDEHAAKTVQSFLNSPNFHTSLCSNPRAVELCGGLKNVLSLACGYCEGLNLGMNVRAAILRCGMHEMVRFIERSRCNHDDESASTTVFTTSAGMGDVILTCTAGRGRLLAAEFVRTSEERRTSSVKQNIERWDSLEQSLLNGMKLPDWHNAQYVHQALSDWKCLEEFPLLTSVYEIGFMGQDPRPTLIEALRKSIQLAGC